MGSPLPSSKKKAAPLRSLKKSLASRKLARTEGNNGDAVYPNDDTGGFSSLIERNGVTLSHHPVKKKEPV